MMKSRQLIRSYMLYGAGIYLILLCVAGCATVIESIPAGPEEDYPNKKSDEDITVKKGKTWKKFLEVIRPEPSWVGDRAREVQVIMNSNYKDAVKRGIIEHEIPDNCILTIDNFRDDPEQDTETGPFLELQLRERAFTEIKKVYEVKWKKPFSDETTTTSESPVVLECWKWEPEKEVAPYERVVITVCELKGEEGFFSVYGGDLDRDGKIRFELYPFLEIGAKLDGMTFICNAYSNSKKH